MNSTTQNVAPGLLVTQALINMKHHLPLLFIFAIFSGPFLHAKKSDDGTAEWQRKADYIFMQGEISYEDDKPGDYFNMLRYARRLDPAESHYSNEIGYFLAILADRESEIDTTILKNGLQMMKESFDSHPGQNMYSAVRYASLCQHFGFTDEALRAWSILRERYPQKPEIAYNYAQIMFEQGDTASIHNAIRIYEELERSQGYGLGLTSQKVRGYFALRDTANVVNELNLLIQRSPKSASNQMYVGDVFMVMQNPDSALAHYNRALELDSANGAAYYKLADYYQHKGDSAAYDREIFNALSQADLEVPDKIELMKSYVQNLFNDESQRPRIQKLFEVLTELHPHEADIHDLYSVYLAVIGDYNQSAEQTSIALDLNPAEITNWNRLISLYLTLGENDKAKDAGKQALHYFPKDANIKLLTSSAYMMTEDYNAAIDLLTQALDETDSKELETLSDIETSLGDAYYKLEQTDSAFLHYDKALEYNPHNLLAMNNCAYFLAVEGKDLQKAENLSYMTLRDDPKNPIYLDTYAWIMFKQKNYDEAKNYIDKTMEADENPSGELYEHAGDIYFMNLLPAEALEFWKKALELDPDNDLLLRKVKEKTYLTK